MAEVWKVGVWEAPGRSRNGERVCGPCGTCGRHLGLLVWGGAGGRIQETLMRKWDPEPRKCSDLPWWPYLLLSLVGHLVNPLLSSSLPPKSLRSSLAPRPYISPHLSISDAHPILPEKKRIPTCSQLFLPAHQSRNPHPHLLQTPFQ